MTNFIAWVPKFYISWWKWRFLITCLPKLASYNRKSSTSTFWRYAQDFGVQIWTTNFHYLTEFTIWVYSFIWLFLRSKNFRICMCELSYQTVDIFKIFLRFQPTWNDLEICRTIFSTKLRKLRIQVKDRIDCFFPRSCLHEFSEEDAIVRVKCGDLTVLGKAFSKTL